MEGDPPEGFLTGRLKGEERLTGIEPAYHAWEAGALPLSYSRICNKCTKTGELVANTIIHKMRERFFNRVPYTIYKSPRVRHTKQGNYVDVHSQE